MHDYKNWSELSKNHLPENEYLRQENEMLKEDLAELQKKHNTSSIMSGWIVSYTIFLLAEFTSILSIKRFISISNLFERIVYWSLIPLAFYGIHIILYMAINNFVIWLSKTSKTGEYKATPKVTTWKTFLPFIIYLIIAVVFGIWGPH